jgi:rare lipoprotein A
MKYSKKVISGLVVFSLFPLLTSCSTVSGLFDNDSDSGANTSISSGNSKACGDIKSSKSMKSAVGYKADGIATWYTDDKQGSQTAGCETFDANGYTGAHKNLPLPTYVRVTNKNNGKSVVVRVNDRLSGNASSLIKLTKPVATMLGHKGNKAMPVHIEALVSRQASAEVPIRLATNSRKPKQQASRSALADNYYIVVGTYTNIGDAMDMFSRLSSIGLTNPALESRRKKGRLLHMVRLGPFTHQDEIDLAKDKLRNDGLATFTVVKN